MGNKILVGSNFTGFKNRIINGGFQVWQRGTSFAYDGGKEGYYTADRILGLNASDGQFTVSKSNIDGKNSIKFTVDTSVSDLSADKRWNGLEYKFEGQHLYDLYIKKSDITISFLFKSNVSGKFQISLRNYTADANGNKNVDSYVTTFDYDGSETAKRIQVTIPLNYNFQNPPKNDENLGFVIDIGFLNQGNYVTNTVNQWHAGNYLTTSDCVNWGAAAGNYWEIAELQLEEGDIATEFEYVTYDVELLRCMRYYINSISHRYVGYVGGTTEGVQAVAYLPTNMRSIPAVTKGTTSALMNCSDDNIVVFSLDCRDIVLYCSTWSSSGTARMFCDNTIADAEL